MQFCSFLSPRIIVECGGKMYRFKIDKKTGEIFEYNKKTQSYLYCGSTKNFYKQELKRMAREQYDPDFTPYHELYEKGAL